jgi:hypothetical protein
MPKHPSPALSLASVFVIFFALHFPYHYGFRFLPVLDSVTFALRDALIFTTLFWISTRLDLARVTLCFLALPYLIFFPGWLNTATAVALLIIFIYCMANTLRSTTAISNSSLTLQDLFTFVLIIIWVNLSGAGGYGHQSADYAIHNSRLKDLVDYTWPVHYGENRNFVSYFAYFLPAATIGKLSNAEIALRSMYPWTILGVTLVLRWLSYLSGWRFSLSLVFIFIFFGPLDILNLFILGFHANIPLNSAFSETLVNTDYLDFRTQYDIGFNIGNYLSTTFQLFWSPHQVIAGWLCISLMTHLYMQKQNGQFIFIYALLCLWSPLIMIALFPFVLAAIVTTWFDKKWRDIFTLENTLGAGAISTLFVVFYLAGSPQSIPSPFILDGFDWKNKSGMLILFYLSAWGLYAAALTPFVRRQHAPHITWFLCLIFILLLLPLKKFGAYSDLLCRGSAPLMFLLLIFILQAINHYQQKRSLFVLMLCLLLLGSASALLQLRSAINNYDDRPDPAKITDYLYAEENLGPDNTFFNHHFRRRLSESNLPK